MSCWVVPSIAADLWGVSVQQVIEKAQAGSIPSKSEAGFTFIDVAPDSPTLQTPKPLRKPAPPTYTVVTQPELALLVGESSDEEGSSADWRSVRGQTGHRRRAPIAA